MGDNVMAYMRRNSSSIMAEKGRALFTARGMKQAKEVCFGSLLILAGLAAPRAV